MNLVYRTPSHTANFMQRPWFELKFLQRETLIFERATLLESRIVIRGAVVEFLARLSVLSS